MRATIITREVGSALYWVEFLEDGKRADPLRRCYMYRWTARRAAKRFLRGKLNPFREEIR